MYLLDTDTCVYWLRGERSVHERLSSEDVRNIALSIITLAELRYGADCSARPSANHEAIDRLAGTVQIVGLDEASARAFGSIKSRLRREGNLIEDLDLLIAAISVTHSMIVVTNNGAHFGRIPELRLENWISPR
jgi:tRNA(fMet)-specific endonuclease VapC